MLIKEKHRRSSLPSVPSSCPSAACSHPQAAKEEISAAALASLGVAADWTSEALRCVNCGCVYSALDKPAYARGYFNHPLFPNAKWLPIHRSR